MTRIRFARNSVSNGVAALSAELQARGHQSRLLRLRNSRYIRRPNDIVINWGAVHSGAGVLNCYAYRAADKIAAFELLSYNLVSIPDYTTDVRNALQWIEEGEKVVCRTLTRSSSGNGIVLASTAEELVNAPLYTKYIPKQQEYRIHVFNGKVIDYARKARNRSVDDGDVNWQIRTHDNGFVYAREGFEPQQALLDEAIKAVRACNLTFGAVDIIYNERRDKYYVLEINTAPGLVGTTVQRYADAIEQYIEDSY